MTSRRRSRPLFLVAFLLLHPVACKSAEPPSIAVRGRYGRAVEELSSYIASELADKAIPGLSIALVDGSNVVWSCGFGTADPDAGLPASAETLYRVGSVSKLFTDIAVMQLVERGQLDLDQPVRNYLPEFRPDNPFGKEITLRQLMSHRSGLVREPPVGHYFDASSPTLAATVASLNRTTLVYEPETRVKYSNAAIAVVGYVLEELSGRPFAEYLEDAVLDPIGMEDSAFVPRERTARRLAKAVMWSYDGRSFPAPTFELGMAPAGSMYSTVLDLCDFMAMLLRRGAGTVGPVLRPESLGEMFTPQFAEEGATRGFGLGFQVGQIDGHLSLGHGGAIYGFATSLKVLPEAGLGVVAIANMDVVNSVTGRIVDQALRMMLAARAGRELPPPDDPIRRPEAGQETTGPLRIGRASHRPAFPE
jgi:serine beta-lactamase-like protein LACTB